METVTKQRKCSMCQQPGHNKRTCPARSTWWALLAAAAAEPVPFEVKSMEKPTVVVPPAKRTVERQIDLLCWNAGLPVEVVRLIKVSLHRSKMAECMAQAFHPKWVSRIVRMDAPTHLCPAPRAGWRAGWYLRYATPGAELRQVNYGRLLVHLMHPWRTPAYNKRFRLLDNKFANTHVVF